MPATTHLSPLVHPERDEITVEGVLRALADPVRLAIVRQLAAAGTEVSCGGLDVPVTKSTLTHHLGILRQAGVTSGRQEGTTRFNSLRRNDLDDLFPGLLDGVLAARR
ncbi:helix-turn-helix transcriptional regulator [Amycolatopsis sp. FDAARGOS 1241]|uniref:ArsR/SmtB family transcription factor n=1 Tax=Amycolatopsis sp. FDAARGOS 1241 TaxID=2778070 RepID=UPI00194DC0CD|nr:metalloregulator ArsR/SmtB family transcription factor [Amycolatopsis sp. FDAARGOS 1241]QRP45277.1 helix-turn-helix transcriptional regulator [Amycolatopsis sp. FDAARGOS 1241]